MPSMVAVFLFEIEFVNTHRSKTHPMSTTICPPGSGGIRLTFPRRRRSDTRHVCQSAILHDWDAAKFLGDEVHEYDGSPRQWTFGGIDNVDRCGRPDMGLQD